MTLVNENGLNALVTVLREGRDNYAFAASEARDPEIADAFALAAKYKTELLDGLVAARVLQHASADHAVAPAPTDEGYARLRAQFDPYHPEVQGVALYERERHVTQLIQSVFRTENSMGVRRALKNSYAHMAQLVGIMQRLAKRRQAA